MKVINHGDLEVTTSIRIYKQTPRRHDLETLDVTGIWRVDAKLETDVGEDDQHEGFETTVVEGAIPLETSLSPAAQNGVGTAGERAPVNQSRVGMFAGVRDNKNGRIGGSPLHLFSCSAAFRCTGS